MSRIISSFSNELVNTQFELRNWNRIQFLAALLQATPWVHWSPRYPFFPLPGTRFRWAVRDREGFLIRTKTLVKHHAFSLRLASPRLVSPPLPSCSSSPRCFDLQVSSTWRHFAPTWKRHEGRPRDSFADKLWTLFAASNTCRGTWGSKTRRRNNYVSSCGF